MQRGSKFVVMLLLLLLSGSLLIAGQRSTPPSTRSLNRVVEDVRAIPDPREFLDGRLSGSNERSVSIVSDSRTGSMGLEVRAAGSAQVIVICAAGTSWDAQHPDDGQKQIARIGGGNLVHFVWNHEFIWPDHEDPGSYVNYQAYSASAGIVFGDCGSTISGAEGDPKAAYGGSPTIGVATGDQPRPAFHQRSEAAQPSGPFSSWVLNLQLPPGLTLYSDWEMPGSEGHEAIYPHIAIDRRGSEAKLSGSDVYHVASRSDYFPDVGAIFYWRRVGAGIWEGPVILDHDDGTSINHHVATNPVTEEVAVVYLRDQDNPVGNLDVVYVESGSNGSDWIATETPIFPSPVGPTVNGGRRYVTSYDDLAGPQSWLECTGEYDLDGRLHIVWVEQAVANVSSDCRIRHWDDIAQTPRTIAAAIDFANTGNDGMRDLWLAYPQIGIGDGSTLCTDGPTNPGSGGTTSNRNYLYVTYNQYGGPSLEEGNDVSGWGNIQNLEVYLAASNDHGDTWSPPLNLTNTKTPGCDGTPGLECASEAYPSIALTVDDTIHISYILDISAGDAVFGQGMWVFNPVHYLRIPGGTDIQPICPALSPVILASLSNQQPECEYNAPPGGSIAETLTIQNLGNAALSGSISNVGGAAWLQLIDGAYTINPGGPDDVRTVTMDATGLAEGLYQETISITHNDTTQASPIEVPVDFFVFYNFSCPEYVTLNTGWVWLEIGNTGRMGNHNRAADESTGSTERPGWLARLSTDSSWSLADASLLIAMPPNPDTVVWRNLYGAGNGQPGFRALSPLWVDTTEYGTAQSHATAMNLMTTMDSTIDIEVTYTFPQHPDSAEFVLVEYRMSNRTASPILDMVVGAAADFDVVPGVAIRSVQRDVQNSGHLQENWNMVYQQGADTTGHTIVGETTASRFKAGMTALQTDAAPRAWVAPNDPHLDASPGGGFSERYLYANMTGSGFELFPYNDPNPEEDLHSVMVFDQDVDLAPGEIRHFALGLISSNQGNDDPTDLIASTKKAWKYAFGWVSPPEVPEEFFSAFSVPYYARGTHEDGVGSPCSGCEIDLISGFPDFWIVPSPDPCFGQLFFAESLYVECGFTAVLRVRDLCGTYEDIVVVSVPPAGGCLCPFHGDLTGDGFIDSIDLSLLIEVVFFGGADIRDPGCPVTRADFTADCFADAIDISALIDYMFFGSGGGPIDPCSPASDCWCQ